MSLHEPPARTRTRARAWSPATETREEVKALLGRRSTLTRDEVFLYRSIYPDFYDTYVDTLRCVVRSRGAAEAVELDLVHDALATFWDETRREGFPESIQAKLLSLAGGLARNHVDRERRNPTKHEMPTSSKESPGSFPNPERAIDLKAEAAMFFERLSPEHQAVVDAVILRDLTVVEAARELGLHRTTASSRLTAALALLREMADEFLSESERHV